jgi:hypothetical protein
VSRKNIKEQTLEKIEYCRNKGVALASIIFKIVDKNFADVPLELEDKEILAKRLVLRLHDKVDERFAFAAPKVNTVVPFFDIEYFNIFEHFIKEDSEYRKEQERRWQDMVKKEVESLEPKEHKLKQGSNLSDLILRGKVEEELKVVQRRGSINAEKKLSQAAPEQNRRLSSHSAEDNKTEDTTTQNLSDHTYDDVISHMPKIISKKEETEAEKIVQAKGRSQSLITKHKPGLNITTNSLGLLFRLTKNLEKRVKLRDHSEFDRSLDFLKEIFGLSIVHNSVMEIKNQSLSKLGILVVTKAITSSPSLKNQPPRKLHPQGTHLSSSTRIQARRRR